MTLRFFLLLVAGIIPGVAFVTHIALSPWDARADNVDVLNAHLILALMLPAGFGYWRHMGTGVSAAIFTVGLYAMGFGLLGVDAWRREQPLSLTARGESAINTLAGEHNDALPVVIPQTMLGRPLTIEGVPVQPLGGFSRRRTLLCNEGAGWISYQADRFGFRNDDTIWDHGKTDIMLIGDSFGHGYCVEEKQSIAGFLRDSFGSLANVSMSGNDPALELASLKEYYPLVNAKTIIWVYYEGNDLLPTVTSLSDPILHRYLEPGFRQELPGKQRDIDSAYLALAAYRLATTQTRLSLTTGPAAATPPATIGTTVRILRSATAHLAFAGTVGTVRRILNDRMPWVLNSKSSQPSEAANTQEALAALDLVFREAVRYGCDHGAPIIVLFIPDMSSLIGGDSHPERARVQKLMRDAGMKVIDVTDRLRSHEQPRELVSGHLTAAGYRILMENAIREIGPMVEQPSHSTLNCPAGKGS